MNELLAILKENGWEDALIKNIEMVSKQVPGECSIDYIDINKNVLSCIDSDTIKINTVDVKDYNIFKL